MLPITKKELKHIKVYVTFVEKESQKSSLIITIIWKLEVDAIIIFVI